MNIISEYSFEVYLFNEYYFEYSFEVYLLMNIILNIHSRFIYLMNIILEYLFEAYLFNEYYF